MLRQPMRVNAVFELPGACARAGSPDGGVRVLLGAESPDVAVRLGSLLVQAGGNELLTASGPHRRATDEGEPRRPTVLLLDCPSLDRRNLWRPQNLARNCRPARVLWLLDAEPQNDERIHPVVDAVRRGWCHGYLTGDVTPGVLARAVRTLAQDDFWLPRALLGRAILASDDLRVEGDTPPGAARISERNLTQLTSREREILRLVRRGLTNKEIGRYLGIMEDTVKKHLRNMYAKLGVHRRAQMLLSVVGQARTAR